MGYDYVAFANKTKKEYIAPSPGISHSSVSAVVGDWFFSSAVLYLVSEPHRFDLPKNEFGVRLSGSWSNCEYMWVCDYDEIYDGNNDWKVEWKNISNAALVILYEYGHWGVGELICNLKNNPRPMLIIGAAVEETNCEALENELINTFGKGCRKWYYYAKSNKYSADKKWPNIVGKGKSC